MKLSLDGIMAVAMEMWSSQDMVYDYATDYGEPGYRLPDGETPIILLGNWNTTRFGPRTGRKYKRVFAQLESQGVQLEWHDEWEVVDGKAYRTSPDCYQWESAIAFWEGDYITPDDDLETWIRYAVEEVKGINSTQVPDLARKLVEAGFTIHDDDGYPFESGWHQGMDADPEKVREELLAAHGDDVEIIFVQTEASQFYNTWVAYYRNPEEE